ncbi:MAG: two-component system sensor histidine kinase NtrB [Acidobacteriota bacterium]
MPDSKRRAERVGRARKRSKIASRTAEPAAGSQKRHAPLEGDQDFYRNLVWSLSNGVIAINSAGLVTVMNETAYRVLGLAPDKSDIGRHFAEVLREQPDVVRMLGGALDLSTLPNRAELRLKNTRKVIGYTLSHVDDRAGRRIGATLFFKDLTRVEQLEERERLRDRLAALGEMAAAIAHEVKNPLAGIEVMAGILRRQLASNPDAQSVLNDIINEAKMANAIVQDVLEFVRPIRLEVERVSLPAVVHDAVTMAESQFGRANTTVDVQLAPDLPAIQADDHQLRQLFTNLLTNAFEALEGDGRVEIRGSVTEEDHGTAAEPRPTLMVVIEVADNGPGIPRDIVEKVFSPFFTTKAQGSGLGLAIVRKIVDAHDGRIDLSTRPGGGACFRITLPVSSSESLFA